MLVLVAVPVLLLGAVSPWAIRLSVARVEDAGDVAGRLYALSTVGSLVGTFLAALVLDPAGRDAADVPRLRAVVALVAALGAAARAGCSCRRHRRAARDPAGRDQAAERRRVL